MITRILDVLVYQFIGAASYLHLLDDTLQLLVVDIDGIGLRPLWISLYDFFAHKVVGNLDIQ